MTVETGADTLTRAVGGDMAAFEELAGRPQRLILAYARGHTLDVNASSVLCVLRALRSGRISPEHAQRWASFVRRGYISGTTTGPLQPVALRYDASVEDRIADAISRLDEIGDLVDGVLTDQEIDRMITELSR